MTLSGESTRLGEPTRLRVEHLLPGEPCGSAHPRFSWWLPAVATEQLAWQVQVEGPGEGMPFDSGRRPGSHSVLVDPRIPPPGAGERRRWRVRVWTDARADTGADTRTVSGESGWSGWAEWNTGHLDGTELDARWVAPREPVTAPAGERPAYALRREIELPAAPIRATAYATAHGIYELFVNGTRAGDAELTPGFTSYRSRLQVQTVDVTALLVEGRNVLGLLLSDGWFRGRHGFERTADGFGDTTAALLQIVVEYDDGSTTTLGTDASWRQAPSDIVAADLMDGQREAPLLDPGWGRPGFDAGDWERVRVVDDGLAAVPGRLVTSVSPPTRPVGTIPARSVTRLGSGSFVVDFGENLSGWVRLSNTGPEGTALTLTHGEVTADSGEVDTTNIRAFDFVTQTPLPAGQVDGVVSRGAGQVFEPRHTTHGFRFVQIDGHPGPLQASEIEAVRVSTDLERVGGFACSDPRLNQLHEAAVRSFVDNSCDIPTDCPQRERSGFTGDWQIFVETAAFTHDVAGFSDKWLRDLSADQWQNGVVPNIVPDPHGNGPVGAFTDMTNGSAGWADAAVIVPWRLFRQYGDERMLERQYPSMCAWVDYAARGAAEHRHPDRVAVHPEPQPHERYLWDTGFHFGEWLEPGETPTLDPGADRNGVATAYLSSSADLLSRIAAVLGREGDAARYRERADGARNAWQREQLAPDGALVDQTQAMHVRALAFDLVPADLVQRTADRLADLVRERDYHLSTGFLSTGMLLPALADHGHLDVAYRLLLAEGEPSWLTMIERGATTIWERWDGISAAGEASGSLDHYSKGAVISFLHRHVAGIQLHDMRSGRLTVAPRPGGGLTAAHAWHDSIHGRVESDWRMLGGAFELTVTVPPGVEARVVLPGGAVHTRRAGTHAFREPPPPA